MYQRVPEPLCFCLLSRQEDLWPGLHQATTLPPSAAEGEKFDEQSQEQVARKHGSVWTVSGSKEGQARAAGTVSNPP